MTEYIKNKMESEFSFPLEENECLMRHERICVFSFSLTVRDKDI